MKRLILISILSVFSLFANAQQTDYTFKITGVNNVATSKMPIDIMRKEFLVNPTFNDSIDNFTVPRTQFLSKVELESKLAYYGYTITDFKKPEKHIEKLEKR